MINIIAFIFASGVGFGLSCWIFGKLLDKSNNMGDYKGDKYDYNAYVNFQVRRDRMGKNDYSSFIYQYGERIDQGKAPNGADLVRRLTPEELKKYKKPAPTGDFSSEKSGITSKKSFVDEFAKWECENSSFGDLKGVFKPIETEDEDRAGF